MAGSRGSKAKKSKAAASRNALESQRTAATRTAQIPEILSHILSYANKPTQAACARACRFWNSVALDCLWVQLDCIAPLLRLLSPLKIFKDGPTRVWSFVDNPGDVDWTCFRMHAARVQEISFMEEEFFFNNKSATISSSGISSLPLYSIPGTPLLPNLRRLTWSVFADLNTCMMLPFVSSTVQYLSIRLTERVSEKRANRLFHNLAHRTPALLEFELHSELPSSALATEVARWIRTTPALKTAKLPQFYQTEGIVQAFCKLPNLTSFTSSFDYPQDPDDTGSCFKAPPGSFPTLSTLDIDMSLPGATDILIGPNSLSRLAMVSISSREALPDELAPFLWALTGACPDLRSLRLNLHSEDSDSPSLNFTNLRPLLSCHQLESLEVWHDWPIRLAVADVRDLGNSWRSLKTLILTPTPNDITQCDGNDFEILTSIARECPSLLELGLYLDGDVPDFDFEGMLNPETQFQLLQCLDVGISVVPEDGSELISLMLGSLCPPGFSITTGVSNFYLESEPDDQDEVGQQWESVEKLANKIAESKAAVRRQLDALRKENSELRAANDRLQGGSSAG